MGFGGFFGGGHIRCCGHGCQWFRPYGESLGEAPSNQALLPLSFGASLMLGMPSLRSCSVGPPPSAIHGRGRLTRHPCRVAHCAEPALGLSRVRLPPQPPRRPESRPGSSAVRVLLHCCEHLFGRCTPISFTAANTHSGDVHRSPSLLRILIREMYTVLLHCCEHSFGRCTPISFTAANTHLGDVHRSPSLLRTLIREMYTDLLHCCEHSFGRCTPISFTAANTHSGGVHRSPSLLRTLIREVYTVLLHCCEHSFGRCTPISFTAANTHSGDVHRSPSLLRTLIREMYTDLL